MAVFPKPPLRRNRSCPASILTAQASNPQGQRHCALGVSRMLNAGIPIAKVAKIAGWRPATMVRMAAQYGHFSLNDLRGAVESIGGIGIEVVSPVSEDTTKVTRTN